MAYVDHAFSITDDDDLVGGAVGGPRGAPVKEIAFAAALLAFGVLGVVAGSYMAAHQVGGDSAHERLFETLRSRQITSNQGSYQGPMTVFGN
ncbi:uncharacterized protein LOC112888766 isoform X2 [Panicum hallii]|uniref:uncharacterized protein LOC112888766 isoform X2 n=1 Tax=Panicum hallii TaxID=206008 RepID=UPI000DF4CD50|nr:uncharacterized protein LOC112888766 isoform X2 [Panicum hallii]